MSELVMKAAIDNPKNLLNAGQGATKLDGVQLYTEGKTEDRLLGVHLYPLAKDGGKADALGMGGFSAAHAESATIGDFDLATRILNLTLYNVTIEQKEDGGNIINRLTTAELPLQVHIPIRTTRKMKSNRFTNAEIAETLQHFDEIRTTNPEAMEKYSKAAAQKSPFPCASNLWDAAVADSKHYIGSMNKKNEGEFRTEGVKRASCACACIVFSLIGVPLAITARRRDTSTGFAIGILVAALYFVALVFCETSRKSSGIAPYILLWVPNVLGIAFAIWQHAKAKYRG